MQGKPATLSLFAIAVLALATVGPLLGEQPTGQVSKLPQLLAASPCTRTRNGQGNRVAELTAQFIAGRKKA